MPDVSFKVWSGGWSNAKSVGGDATGSTNTVVESAETFQIASSLRRSQFASQAADDFLGSNKTGLIAFWTVGDERSMAAGGLGEPHRASAAWTIVDFRFSDPPRKSAAGVAFSPFQMAAAREHYLRSATLVPGRRAP